MKTFEQFSAKKEPEIGDWIIDISGEYGIVDDILTYTGRKYVSITQLVNFHRFEKFHKLYSIKYDQKYNKKLEYLAKLSGIKFVGTKEEVEMQVQANKYNI